MVSITVDDQVQQAEVGELLVDVFSRSGKALPHVCYHPQLGPVQTCDTCMVKIGGRLVRLKAFGRHLYLAETKTSANTEVRN